MTALGDGLAGLAISFQMPDRIGCGGLPGQHEWLYHQRGHRADRGR